MFRLYILLVLLILTLTFSVLIFAISLEKKAILPEVQYTKVELPPMKDYQAEPLHDKG